MINEYTDCAEFKRLIEEKKIKSSAVKKFFKNLGIVFTASNASSLSDDCYTIFLGGDDINQITHMIIDEGNYEKSTLVNAYYNCEDMEEYDVLDYISDEMNAIRSCVSQRIKVEQPVKDQNNHTLTIDISFLKQRPGKNKLISEEERRVHLIIRKKDLNHVSIDIRHPSSSDSQIVLDLFEQITKTEGSRLKLSHITLDALTEQNRITFFDRIATNKFKRWTLKTITGITVKKSTSIEDYEDILSEDSNAESLSEISQAVLHGSGLRTNSFVQNSLKSGYYISSMTYRFVYKQEASEFILSITSKDKLIRIDIDKSYDDEDGTLRIQPLSKSDQDEIIIEFQKLVDSIFSKLYEQQVQSSDSCKNI